MVLELEEADRDWEAVEATAQGRAGPRAGRAACNASPEARLPLTTARRRALQVEVLARQVLTNPVEIQVGAGKEEGARGHGLTGLRACLPCQPPGNPTPGRTLKRPARSSFDPHPLVTPPRCCCLPPGRPRPAGGRALRGEQGHHPVCGDPPRGGPLPAPARGAGRVVRAAGGGGAGVGGWEAREQYAVWAGAYRCPCYGDWFASWRTSCCQLPGPALLAVVWAARVRASPAPYSPPRPRPAPQVREGQAAHLCVLPGPLRHALPRPAARRVPLPQVREEHSRRQAAACVPAAATAPPLASAAVPPPSHL